MENLDGVDDLKNCVAIHRLVSIAASTNRGHSQAFVRESSSHDAAVKMIESFLSFLDDINAAHDDEIPDYFHEAIEYLELMTSDQSTLRKSDKMHLLKLTGSLKKYLLHDHLGLYDYSEH